MEVRPLEQLLCGAGHLDVNEFRLAREELARFGSIHEAAIALGFIGEDAWVRAVCQLTHSPAIDLTAKTVEAEVLALVSSSVIEKYRCLPLFVGAAPSTGPTQRSLLYLGLEDPLATGVAAEVARSTGFEVRPVVVGPLQLSLALDRFYPPSTRRSVSNADALVASDTSPLVGGPGSGEPADAREIARAVIVEPEQPDASAESDEAAEADGATETDGDDEHEVSTRIILKALTKLLVAKGVIDRNDLLAEVAEIRARERLQPID